MPAGPAEDERLAHLSKLCLALPEAVREETHGGHATFRVRSKPFAYFLNNHHDDGIVSVCVKADPGANTERATSLPDLFYLPAYLAHRGWFAMRLDRGAVDWNEVASIVQQSYGLTAPKGLVKMIPKQTGS